MFNKSKKKKSPKFNTRVDTLIGKQTHLKGDIEFNGGLRIDGKVTGNINAVDDIESILSLNEQGQVNGDIRVPNMIINGHINGDVYAIGHLELADKAKINGNVFYKLIEMAVGAEVNGQLIHMSADDNAPQALESAVKPPEPVQLEQQPDS